VLAAGATKYDFQPNNDHCSVFADPAGHAFCLSTWGKSRLKRGPVSRRLPDKIAMLVSATQPCKNRATYRCKSH